MDLLGAGIGGFNFSSSNTNCDGWFLTPSGSDYLNNTPAGYTQQMGVDYLVASIETQAGTGGACPSPGSLRLMGVGC